MNVLSLYAVLFIGIIYLSSANYAPAKNISPGEVLFRQAGQFQDYAPAENQVNKSEIEWDKSGKLDYFDQLKAVCNEMASDGRPQKNDQEYMLKAIENATGKTPVGNIKRYDLLYKQAEFLPIVMSSDAFGNDYKEQRCAILDSIMAKVNAWWIPNYTPKQTYANIPPVINSDIKAGEVPMGGTMDTNRITNIKLREEYSKPLPSGHGDHCSL